MPQKTSPFCRPRTLESTFAKADFQRPAVHFLGDIRVVELIGELIE